METPTHAPHGTHARFHAGCRCERCREAENDYHRVHQREYRRRRAEAGGREYAPHPRGQQRYLTIVLDIAQRDAIQRALVERTGQHWDRAKIEEYAKQALFLAIEADTGVKIT